MRIGVPAEIRAGETRVAVTPETVKKLAAKNEVRVQAGAGAGSSIPDQDYEAAGAKLAATAAEAYDADIVLKVRAPQDGELAQLKSGSTLIGLLNPFDAPALEALAQRGVTGFAMEWLPVALFSYIAAGAGFYLIINSIVEITNSNIVGWISFMAAAAITLSGVLHVLGHDHPAGAACSASPMWRRQEQYLRRLGAGVRA